MQVTPEILFKGVEKTQYIDELIARGIAKLERVCDYIVSARITVEQVNARHQTGNPHRVLIEISIRDRPDIVVERLSNDTRKIPNDFDEADSRPARKSTMRRESLSALINMAFDSTKRELEKVVDKQRSAVKVHPQQQAQAMVEKIFKDQQYGFLRTLDGQQVYFHRNSVLHNHWDKLTVGTAVRCTSEMGDKGLQASTVELVEKQGAAEIHGSLHDSYNES